MSFVVDSMRFCTQAIVIVMSQNFSGLPHPRFGSVVRTDDAAHVSRQYENIYYSHTFSQAFWGKAEAALKQVRKWLERASEKDWLDFYIIAREVAWVPCAG